MNEILEYISRKREEDNALNRYLHGDCYRFSVELTSIFGGTPYINSERNHVVSHIRGRLYDITGCISRKQDEQYHPMSQAERKAAGKWAYKKNPPI